MVLIEAIAEIDSTNTSISTNDTSDDLLRTLKQLSARLALPEELLLSFVADDGPQEALEMYHNQARSILRQIKQVVKAPTWASLPAEARAAALFDVFRLYGSDPWTSEDINHTIDDITSTLDIPATSLFLLQSLRSYFASNPHPLLNTATNRALPRPAGGKAAQSDFADSETQPFKQRSAWGCHNVLGWAASHTPPRELERRIGLILPPTLVLMDDWEPQWRGRGVQVLKGWVGGLDVGVMKRMGVDKLLRTSLVHTLSLHPSPPLSGVMSVAIDLIDATTEGKEKAGVMGEVVEKGVIQGWTYAPSGKDGRAVLIAVAADLELLCQTLGEGIVRWMKTIIPNLLDPLQYPPSPAVLPHYRANLSALSTVLRSVKSTGRAERWRGQIMDVLCRLWVQLEERGEESSRLQPLVEDIRKLIKTILQGIIAQTPSVRTMEFEILKTLDTTSLKAMVSTL